MELTVEVICRPDFSAGFALAGLKVTHVADAAQAADAVKRLAAAGEAGVLLVESTLYEALPGELRARLDRQALPVVAPFPGPGWDEAGEAEAYVLEILRQAIGYRVRPR